jgi:hypothetical protein
VTRVINPALFVWSARRDASLTVNPFTQGTVILSEETNLGTAGFLSEADNGVNGLNLRTPVTGANVLNSRTPAGNELVSSVDSMSSGPSAGGQGGGNRAGTDCTAGYDYGDDGLEK